MFIKKKRTEVARERAKGEKLARAAVKMKGPRPAGYQLSARFRISPREEPSITRHTRTAATLQELTKTTVISLSRLLSRLLLIDSSWGEVIRNPFK